MTTARQIFSLLKSHFEGDDTQFFAVAMQVAAEEARAGHAKIATEIRDLIDAAKARPVASVRSKTPIPLAQPKGELAHVLAVRYPNLKFSDMVLAPEIAAATARILEEQRHQERLRSFDLVPRRKILLVGPPGAGKTMTAEALAGELKVPLFTVVLDNLISRFMGETAAKLRSVFSAMHEVRGVYFFDEFDAIGAKRVEKNDVGEIRRVLNSFLQLLEGDLSHGLVVCATNHPELLDRALFRRFDDVISYTLPSVEVAERLLKSQLSSFQTTKFDWGRLAQDASGLSHADLVRAARDAAKAALLSGRKRINAKMLREAIAERRQ